MKNSALNPFKKFLSLFLAFLILFQTACQYIKVRTVLPDDKKKMSKLEYKNDKFAVHYGNKVFLLKDITLDSLNLNGVLVDSTNFFYFRGHRDRIANKEASVINEVHIYLKDSTLTPIFGATKIPLNQINEIRVIDPNNGQSVGVFMVGLLGVTAGVIVIIIIIALLTKSSCPYIYVNNQKTFVFEGETFGGAIAPNLERDDYMPLPSLKAEDNEYRIRISNELKERQYTNLAKLVVVNHNKDQAVILDRKGKIQTIASPQNPVSAITIGGENILSSVTKKDHDMVLFNNKNYSKNHVELAFDKPADAQNCKLVLNAKNTLWFDYMFGDFLSKFGSSYDSWMAKQAKLSAEERQQKIKDFDFPLSIYVKKNSVWQLVDKIPTVGPLAYREMVVPIDCSGIANDKVEVKIETGFMFWELDYAAMDFSKNEALKTQEIDPVSAIGSGNIDWKDALLKADGKYMAQDNTGDVTNIVYKVPEASKDEIQTVFLHTKGYYQLKRNFKGAPQIVELNKFKSPGYFSDYSRVKYLETLEKSYVRTNVNGNTK